MTTDIVCALIQIGVLVRKVADGIIKNKRFIASVTTIHQLGLCKTNNMAKNTERIHQLESFLQESPTDAFILYALGLEYVEHDLPTALQYFERVMIADMGYLPNYYHLGKSLVLLGHMERASQVLQAGIILATQRADRHALRELKQAYQLWVLGEEED